MNRKSGLIPFALLAVLCAGAFADETDQPQERKFEDTPKLSVRGEAELEKPADQLRLTVGVRTENKEAAAALDANSATMRKVVQAVERIGLSEDEYETGRFSIRPTYSRRPRQAEPDWRPQIVGYEIVNSIVIKTKQMDLAGKLIGAANKAGANSIDSIGFELSDPRSYRAEAIQQATRHALSDAAALAEAASLRLVRVIAITLDHSPVRGPDMAFATGRAMAETPGAPPISPGDVTVRAAVTIVYEIEAKE